MTLEDLRTKKALALLDYQEADQMVESLLKKAKSVAKSFSSVAQQLESNPLGLLETDEARYSDANVTKAYEIARQLQDAIAARDKAKECKKVFGME
jgi:hypothetical protein